MIHQLIYFKNIIQMWCYVIFYHIFRPVCLPSRELATSLTAGYFSTVLIREGRLGKYLQIFTQTLI